MYDLIPHQQDYQYRELRSHLARHPFMSGLMHGPPLQLQQRSCACHRFSRLQDLGTAASVCARAVHHAVRDRGLRNASGCAVLRLAPASGPAGARLACGSLCPSGLHLMLQGDVGL